MRTATPDKLPVLRIVGITYFDGVHSAFIATYAWEHPQQQNVVQLAHIIHIAIGKLYRHTLCIVQ